MVFGGVFSMYVKSFNRVQVGSFLLEVLHLHNIVYGVEGMPFFIKMLCKSGCMAIITEGLLVLACVRSSSYWEFCGWKYPDSLECYLFLIVLSTIIWGVWC